jgi:hypothetical protein
MAEVGVDDDPETLELVQVSVDRGDVHPGCPSLYRSRQLLGGQVALGAEEHLQHCPAGQRGAPTPGAHGNQDLIHRGGLLIAPKLTTGEVSGTARYYVQLAIMT